MSMNIKIDAVRKATVIVKGNPKIIEDRISFKCWQTPTDVSYKIAGQPTTDEQIAAYIKWVNDQACSYDEDVYDYTGKMDEDFNYPVIGKRTIHPNVSHIQHLVQWLIYCDDEDYVVKIYVC